MVEAIRQMTFYDKLLIVVIFLMALIINGLILANNSNQGNKVVAIKQGDNKIAEYSISKSDNEGIHSFRFDGGEGALEIKDGKVRLLPMPRKLCPEAICSNTGWIEKAPQTIICLPNKLIVSFAKSDGMSKVDAVSF